MTIRPALKEMKEDILEAEMNNIRQKLGSVQKNKEN